MVHGKDEILACRLLKVDCHPSKAQEPHPKIATSQSFDPQRARPPGRWPRHQPSQVTSCRRVGKLFSTDQHKHTPKKSKYVRRTWGGHPVFCSGFDRGHQKALPTRMQPASFDRHVSDKTNRGLRSSPFQRQSLARSSIQALRNPKKPLGPRNVLSYFDLFKQFKNRNKNNVPSPLGIGPC